LVDLPYASPADCVVTFTALEDLWLIWPCWEGTAVEDSHGLLSKAVPAVGKTRPPQVWPWTVASFCTLSSRLREMTGGELVWAPKAAQAMSERTSFCIMVGR